jgi:hypothetical protein
MMMILVNLFMMKIILLLGKEKGKGKGNYHLMMYLFIYSLLYCQSNKTKIDIVNEFNILFLLGL